MSLLQWLQGLASSGPTQTGDTETVRRIVGELGKLDATHARYVAAFAYILSRVANADLRVSDEETVRMMQLVQRVGNLPEAQALVVVEIAKSQNRLFGGTENFLVTREFREIASDDQRKQLLECLFAVSAADDAITGAEESQIWQIASELGFTHGEYVEVRAQYADKRTVLRDPPL
jgi:uncharacterized tellurite resistance protein B-like protein